MSIIRNQYGETIRRSRNLRGILDHARRVPVSGAVLQSVNRAMIPELREMCNKSYGAKYLLTVKYDNGDRGYSPFQDWRVCADWLAARRSWGPFAVTGPVEFRTRYLKAAPDAVRLYHWGVTGKSGAIA